ncbi:MAG: hypothetical protein WC307_02575 [Candidatus Nanoarchaeia archaeon]|jgi:hypothetical protein
MDYNNNLKSFIELDNKLKELFEIKRGLMSFHVDEWKFIENKFKSIKKAFKKMTELARRLTLESELFNKFDEKVKIIISECFNSFNKMTKAELTNFNKSKVFHDKVLAFSREFGNKVKKHIIWCYIEVKKYFYDLTGEAQSLNELLTLLHSFTLLKLLNREEFYTSKYGHYSFIGKEDDLSNEIKNLFLSKKLDEWVAGIDILLIISFDDIYKQKFIIVRDLGHATTVNIKCYEGGLIEFYFNIPKAFNESSVEGVKDFVKELKGQFDYNKNGIAYGLFSTRSRDKVIELLFEFFKRVPTDTTVFRS